MLGDPAIVTAPLSAVTSKSFAVPLCAFAVGATAVQVAAVSGMLPTAAAVISLGGLVITGRTLPDLWSASALTGMPGNSFTQAFPTGPPPIAHLMGV